MKPTDLNFKVLTPTPERARKLIEACNKAGIEHASPKEMVAAAITVGHMSYWSRDYSSFDEKELPEVTFTEALELLVQVEAPVPTFDIKLRDEVLCRDTPADTWEIKHFARVGEPKEFKTFGAYYGQMVKYAGNEHLHGTATTPDGWWEVENGKPVWRRK